MIETHGYGTVRFAARIEMENYPINMKMGMY
jgi:hypothetical protein